MKKAKKIKELELSGAKLPRRVVERQIIKEIIPWLKRDEIIIITGPRQTGKSVLLYQLIYGHLLPKTNNIYYFNLDLPGHLRFFSDADRLIKLVQNNQGRSFVFIDEIQRLKEPGLFLKGIYDLHLPVKIIVSGSSELDIKSHVHEALTGRKAVFCLNPFNLRELSAALFAEKDYTSIVRDKNKFNKVLGHYLIFGGYPAVALAKGDKLKLDLLKEIFMSYYGVCYEPHRALYFHSAGSRAALSRLDSNAHNALDFGTFVYSDFRRDCGAENRRDSRNFLH